MNPVPYSTQWRKPPQIIKSRVWRWVITLLCLIYLWFAIGSIDINWLRIYEGLERAQRFIGGFLQPDFSTRWRDISAGMIESLTMTLTSTVVGIALAIPVGLGAARNLSPTWVYMICRAFIALSRSLQEIIVAIFFVALFGFGAFAGFLTLTFATIGFIGKLQIGRAHV